MAARTTYLLQDPVTDAADRLVRSFNTWAFKREQPSDQGQIFRLAHSAVATGTPLKFVLYWGKGPRSVSAAPDLVCLDYLGEMADRIRSAHAPGAAIELLLTDTHARLNGHHARDIDGYFAAIGSAAAARGFTSRPLSDVDDAVVHPGDLPSVAKDDVPAHLIDSAAKWYRGPGSALDGAATYYAMNMVEKAAVERAYPDAIFITFNNSRLRPLFPDALPVFYMYSLRKGFAVKPWFMDDALSTAGGTGSSAFSTAAE